MQRLEVEVCPGVVPFWEDVLTDWLRRFPKIPNDVIKDTLGSHFAQIGTKRDEKKWVFVGAS